MTASVKPASAQSCAGRILRPGSLSPAARIWLATRSAVERALIRADIDHLHRHPDPAGDLRCLQMVLRLAQRRAA